MPRPTILVTGATRGLGFAAARALARQGAHVVMVGRDPARTAQAAADVAAGAGPGAGPGANAGASSGTVSHLLCDFSSQADVRRLAREFLDRHERLDILVNNAGGVNAQRRLTADGIEMTFAVNHLGPFLLTNLLRARLVHSAPARVVTVASVGHRRGTLDFDDLSFARGGYGIMRAYGRSKLANILFANALARRLAGTGVTSNSLHPGAVDTDIWSGAPWWAKSIVQLLFRPFFISVEQGASHIVHLATGEDVSGVTGKYFEEGKLVDPAPLAQDAALAEKLWDVSEQMVGLRP